MKQVRLLWGAVTLLSVTAAILLLLLLRSGNQVPVPEPGPTQTSSPTPEPTDDPIVAKVGDEVIYSHTLNEALLHKQGAELLSQMIDRTVIRLEADALKLKPTAAEIDTELKRMQQGYESEEEFYRSMKDQLGMSKDELREDVYYKLLLEKIATKDISITQQEIDAYLTAHPEEFKSRVQLHLQQIVNQTLEQAKRTVELIRGGQSFEQAARDRSLDTATANDGGDLGWIDEDDPFVEKPILHAASALKAGEISEPQKLEDGRYAVIKLKERRELNRWMPDEVRLIVRQQLAAQKAPPFTDVVKQLRQKYKAQVLDPALLP